MAIQIINTGTSANAGNGDSIRTAFQKVNFNFDYLEGLALGTSTSLTSSVQSVVRPMLVHDAHNGISASYNSINNRVILALGNLNLFTATNIVVNTLTVINSAVMNDVVMSGKVYMGFVQGTDDINVVKYADDGSLTLSLKNTYGLGGSEIELEDNISGSFRIVHQNSGANRDQFQNGQNYIYDDLGRGINIGRDSTISFFAKNTFTNYIDPELRISTTGTFISNNLTIADTSINWGGNNFTYNADNELLLGNQYVRARTDRLTSGLYTASLTTAGNFLLPGDIVLELDTRIPNGLTVTNYGTTFSSIGPFAGVGSFYFDGSSYLSVSGGSHFDLFTTTSTLEWFERRTVANPVTDLTSWALGSTQQPTLDFTTFTAGTLTNSGVFFAGDIGLSFLSSSLYNNWTHYAAVISSSTFKLFVNGAIQINTGVTSFFNTLTYSGGNFSIGGIIDDDDLVAPFQGYISNMRWDAREVYTATFVPPTSMLTRNNSTRMLLQTEKFTNFIYDSSLSGFSQLQQVQLVISTSSFIFNEQGQFIINQNLPYQNQELAGTSIRVDTDSDFYTQAIIKNASTATTATSDLIFVRNDGNAATGIGVLDIGINSSNYTEPGSYGIHTPGSAYVFSNDADLIIGTQSAGKVVKFHAGETTSSNAIAIFANQNATFAGHVLPDSDLAYDLGSTSSQWRSLYVGTSTVYFGGVPFTVSADGTISVAGNAVVATTGVTSITAGTGTAISSSTGAVTIWATGSGGANTGDITFDATTMSGPQDEIVTLKALDSNDVGVGAVELDPSYGSVLLKGLYANQYTFTDSVWSSAVHQINGATNRLNIQGSTDMVNWLTNNISGIEELRVSWNGGNQRVTPTGLSYGIGGVFIGTGAVAPDPNPTTVTTITIEYYDRSQISVDASNSTIEINGGVQSSIFIRSKNSITIDSDGNNWSFNNNGVLTFPNGTSQNTAYTGAGGGGSTSTLVNGTYTVSLSNTALTQFPAYSGGSLFIQGPEIGSVNSTIAISAANNIILTSNIIGSSKQWTFGTGSNITLPGGGNIIGDDYSIAIVGGNDGSSAYGDVIITTNNPFSTSTWSFGTTGELTLPSGGEITSNQITNEIFGTTTTSLTLVPGGATEAGQRLEIYATIGGEGNHLHLTAGESPTELYLGNDSQYVKLGSMGQIEISAQGGLTLWGEGVMSNAYLILPNNIDSSSTNVTLGNVNGDVLIQASEPGNPVPNNWFFGRDGALTFPDGTTQTTAAVGGGGEGIGTTSTLVSGAYTVALSTSGSLILPGIEDNSTPAIDFFSGAPTNHIVTLTSDWTLKLKSRADGANEGHLWLEAGQNTAVKVHGNGSNVEIVASTGTNAAVWNFTSDGALTFPDGTTQTTAAVIGAATLGDRLTSSTYNVILEGTTGTLSVPNIIIAQGYELGLAGSQGSYEVNRYLRVRDGDVYSHLHLDTPDNNTYDIILGNDSKFVKVDHTGTVVIGTNNGTQNEWIFSDYGALTFPDGALIQNSGFLAGPGQNAVLGQNDTYTQIYTMDNGVGIQTYDSSTYYTWLFDNTGVMTIPSGGDITFDSSATSYIYGVTGIEFADGTTMTTAVVGGGAASTVDITDTNGLTTIYYPTFVENRTTGQTVRADVDLTYRTDDNVLGVGNIAINGTTNSTGTTTGALTVAGGVGVGGDLWAGNIYSNGVQLTAGGGGGGVTSITAGTGTFVSASSGAVTVWVGNTSNLEETFESKTTATGVIVHDCTTNRLFYHTGMTGNFTANFTNLSLSSGEATSVSLVLVQGGTARMCTAVQIASTTTGVTLLWQGAASAPTGNASRTEVVTFSILCTGTNAYTVLGMLTSFGGA